MPALRVNVSFVFGPARGEVAIPDDSLHVHVSGPISVGDLEVLTTILPFHAVAFRKFHRTLVGPSLLALIPDRPPSLEDLSFWDELMVRRIRSAPNDAVRRKCLARMLTNRRDIRVYARRHLALLDRCQAVLATATTDEIAAMMEELLSLPKEAAGSTEPNAPE